MKRTRILTECALMTALAAALSVVKVYEAPLGGAVTLFSMAPVILISMYHGMAAGLFTGFVYSAIQIFLGLGNFAYIPSAAGIAAAALLDYIIPFSLIGFAGVFRGARFNPKPRVNAVLTVIAGSALVCVIRYACHVLSGAVIWYEITKNGDWNELVHKTGAVVYSMIYNASFMIPETILTLIAAPVLVTLLGIMGRKTTDSGI